MLENYLIKKNCQIDFSSFSKKTEGDSRQERLQDTLQTMDMQIYIQTENIGESALTTFYKCSENENSILTFLGTSNYNWSSFRIFLKAYVPTWCQTVRTKTVFVREIVKKSKATADINAPKEFEEYILNEEDFFQTLFEYMSNANSMCFLQNKPTLFNHNAKGQLSFGLFEEPILHNSFKPTPMFDLITQHYKSREDVEKILIWFYLTGFHKHKYPQIMINQILWLYSEEGGTGKSTIGNMFLHYFGKSIATTYQTSVDSNNFKAENLIGKFYVHCDEVKQTDFLIENPDIWAIGSAQEDTQINQKGKKAVSVNMKQMSAVITANILPGFRASDTASQRRLLVIHHPETAISNLFVGDQITNSPPAVTIDGLALEFPSIISNGHLLFKQYITQNKMEGVIIPWDKTITGSQLPGIISDIMNNHVVKSPGTKIKRSDFQKNFLIGYLKKNGFSFAPKNVIDEMIRLKLISETKPKNIPTLNDIALREESIETYSNSIGGK